MYKYRIIPTINVSYGKISDLLPHSLASVGELLTTFYIVCNAYKRNTEPSGSTRTCGSAFAKGA